MVQTMSEAPDVPTIDEAVALLDRAFERRAAADPAGARRDCELAIRSFETHDGPLSPDLANALNTLAGIQFDLAEYPASIESATRAHAIMEELGGRIEGPEAALIRLQSLSAIGAALRAQGRYREAEGWLKKGLALVEAEFGPDHPEIATAAN